MREENSVHRGTASGDGGHEHTVIFSISLKVAFCSLRVGVNPRNRISGKAIHAYTL